MEQRQIILKKVRVHNLKGVDLTLEPGQLVVFTGVSGSGKSSMAFDTLFVEGQRRYVESLSTFARRHLGDLPKPDVEAASGLSPTISIEQKTAGRNPRSTVGTMTEIYDYLRVLYARVGSPYCPVSGEPVTPQSKERIIKTVEAYPKGTKLLVLAPYARGKKGEFVEDFQELMRQGYTRFRIDGRFSSSEEEIQLDKSVSHDIDIVIDRLVVEPQNFSRLSEAITQALEAGKGICSVWQVETEQEVLFSMHAYCAKSGLSYPSLEPHDFSFNSPGGMCPTCQGLGQTQEFDLDAIIDKEKSIAEDCCLLASSYNTVRYGNIYDNLARLYHFSVDTPWEKLSEKAKKVFLYGADKKWLRMHFVHPTRKIKWTDYVQWKGVLYEARERYSRAKSASYRQKKQKLLTEQVCPACHGERLKPYPAATRLGGLRIGQLTKFTIQEALSFFEKLKLPASEAAIAQDLIGEICRRLRFLLEVGLHYLTLDRTAPSLSGGEAQRVRLASQIGSGLVGVTYILDEPSIGLHPRDNQRLIHTLEKLRDQGNTVIVVEHDEETILAADEIVDFGPGPGSKGGEIVFQGDLQTLLKNPVSLTAAYLTGREKISITWQKRKVSLKNSLKITGASHHNLKKIDVVFPLGVFIAVTGVSGSGKSSLITDTLYPALAHQLHGLEAPIGAHKTLTGIENIDKVIAIDQAPIGRNPRSNSATYIGVWTDIRNLFCQLPESKTRGFKASRFSFNVKEGSCPHCQGMGVVKIDMDFMEDQWVPCTVCKNRRFDSETLAVLYKGKSIADILEMTVGDALELFSSLPSIAKKLKVLVQVGMEYLTLGQPSTTLSGGEAQRVKLAKELARPATGKTFYILDEPTTGLHFHDIRHLLEVLHELTDRGNTVLVIEHNKDVIKTADWIIDLGPEGGNEGGRLVAEGPLEKIVKLPTPTGKALKNKIKIVPKKKKIAEPKITTLIVKGAQEHNLKNLDLEIPREAMTIFCGPSGSGKSSLAFDTIYAEGQRRYTESLSPYARQFVHQMPKPKVSQIVGLSPAIAIEQKMHAGNPRSTVGTLTEIYDYLRLVYARLGIPHCPETKEPIRSISKEYVVDRLLSFPENTPLTLLAPCELQKQETIEQWAARFSKQGFVRARLNGEFYDLEDPLPYDRHRKNELFLVIDRVKVSPSVKRRIFEAIEMAASLSDNKVVALHGKEETFFNLAFAVESTGKSYAPITPHTFAFNTVEGMCLDCQGLGVQYGANLLKNEDFLSFTVDTLFTLLWGGYQHEVFDIAHAFLKAESIDPRRRLKELTPEQLQTLLKGSEKEIVWKKGVRLRWQGINPTLTKAAKSAAPFYREALWPVLDEFTCPSCQGERLNPLARHVLIDELSIGKLCQHPIDEIAAFIEKLSLKSDALLNEVFRQLIHRLRFLIEIGLSYLSLDRRAPTLSNGEAQRIRLARQLGSGLTGVLYILDEPTVGLHPSDTARLHNALLQLKELGNTLLLVEHDPRTLELADYLFDFGPGAGTKGGHITAQGTLAQLKANPNSLTGAYLSGRKHVFVPKQRRVGKNFLTVKGACKHNLQHVDVSFPVGVFNCLTGVSGSGKSTLLFEVIQPAVEAHLKGASSDDNVTGLDVFDKLICLHQDPLGRTSRSDVCTYAEVLGKLREFYAQLPEAKVRGLQPRHFSYNHRKGMCTTCWGLGYRKIERLFLPALQVTCDQCHGLRLNPLSLTVRYKEKSLGEILQFTVEQARLFFESHPRIVRALDSLIAVGLGYVTLGQEVVTLSGGEAQRLKLSRELAKRSTNRTLYLFDEPTTGLHSDDLQKLLKILHQLVDKGNTVIAIEHNIDFIQNADFIAELGPGAGNAGGRLISSGTLEEINANKNSPTAPYLK